MDVVGRLNVDPSSILIPEAPQQAPGSLEIVVPYTSPEITSRVVEKAAALALGLNAVLKLVAVYIAPYPADLSCPVSMHEHLTARLTKIAERTCLPSTIHLVVARDQDTGFRSALRPGSAVLLGGPRRFWPTREEKLARRLAGAGHHVLLLHFD